MRIEALRKLAGREEIDYHFIISALKDYSRPRDKISAWLKSGELIRVKKGIYIFGPSVALTPYSKEVLANLIYGPSAISLGYALSFYGLIPERAHTVTSITNNRLKLFSTPIGDFSYQYLSSFKYAIGITLNTNSKHQSFLIAKPEKALCDQIHLIDKTDSINDIADIENYLLHHLRIDNSLLKKFDTTLLKKIASAYNDPRLIWLYKYIKSEK